jgi:DNA-directed RNA polymerase specialized sigma24 family protein
VPGFDLDRFHAGDDALFAQLVHTHSPGLLPHLRRYAATDADTQDLLQDVWLRAYPKRRTFAGRGSVFGWLLAVSRTVGLAAVDGRAREPVTEQLRDIAALIAPTRRCYETRCVTPFSSCRSASARCCCCASSKA